MLGCHHNDSSGSSVAFQCALRSREKKRSRDEADDESVSDIYSHQHELKHDLSNCLDTFHRTFSRSPLRRFLSSSSSSALRLCCWLEYSWHFVTSEGENFLHLIVMKQKRKFHPQRTCLASQRTSFKSSFFFLLFPASHCKFSFPSDY